MQSYYKRELYFQGLDIPFYFSIFKFCLSKSDNFNDLKLNLNQCGINGGLDFTRKKEEQTGKTLKFSYPSLSFQAESLFHCWGEILKIQCNSSENIKKSIEFRLLVIDIDPHQ